MSTAAVRVKQRVDPSLLPPKQVAVLRSVLLAVVGLVITFSATMHERFEFDLAVVSAALGLIGVVHLVEAWSRRARGGAAVATALGVVSIVAAVALVAVGTAEGFPVVVAAWALASALLEFVGMVVLPGSRQDAALVGGTGVLLALTVLLTRGDLVAVIGFFGAYAVITGVFLGIAAFDARRETESEDATQQAPVNA